MLKKLDSDCGADADVGFYEFGWSGVIFSCSKAGILEAYCVNGGEDLQL